MAKEGGAGMQMPKGELDEEEGVEDEVTVKTLVSAAILGGLVAPEMKVKEAQIGEVISLPDYVTGFCKLFLASIFRSPHRTRRIFS